MFHNTLASSRCKRVLQCSMSLTRPRNLWLRRTT